jgi:hypothetical protein
MHSSQMKTDGPAMSFFTSCWLLPQNEQYRSFSPLEDFLSDMGSFLWLQKGLAVAGKQVIHKMQSGKIRLQPHATRNKNETPERLIVRASF